MTAPVTCRVLFTEPAPGRWNMALDEALLEEAATGVPTLRFYQWSEPTLSLGYFQTAASRAAHPASSGCRLVRRSSGGGAILHDRELTYCLALPSMMAAAKDTEALYLLVHRSLIAELEELGIQAVLNEQRSRLGRDDEPFLCFQRRAVGDVLCGVHKVAGSAQRRWSGALLQHGSVLLAASDSAPELPGILELGGVAIAAFDLAHRWQRRLASQLGFDLEATDVTPSIAQRAEQLANSKFGDSRWTERR